MLLSTPPHLLVDAFEGIRLPGYTGMVGIDDGGVIRYVSPQLDGLAGFEIADLRGRSFLDFVHVDDVKQAVDSFVGVGERPGYHQALEIRVRNENETVVVDVVADNRRDDPEIGMVVLHLADPRDRRRSALLLDHQAEIVRQIALGDSLQSAVLEVLGLIEVALPGCSAASFLIEDGGVSAATSPSVDRDTLERVSAAITDGADIAAVRALRDEEIIIGVDLSEPTWAETKALLPASTARCWSVPVRFDRGAPVLGCIDVYGSDPAHPLDEDWTVLRLASSLVAVAVDHTRMQDGLISAADVDPLTGTPNRRVVTAVLARMLEAGERGRAVCFIDLDRLKVVNDAMGHEAGDLVIREAATRLTRLVGADGVVGRFGGDEFIAIANSEAPKGDEFAQRCLDAFSEPISVAGHAWQLSASVGLVVIDDQRTPSDVLRDADTAMYQAKRAGRGRWRRFEPADRDSVIRRMLLEQRLSDAVRTGRIAAWFQPIVSSSDWSLVAVEALARWELEPDVWIMPNEFVPLAEELGLIDDLGVSMLDQALAGLDRIGSLHGAALEVSVNVSPIQVRSDRLLDELERVSAERDGAPRVTFEMTEQHMIDDTTATLARLQRFIDVGVGLAVDDFGTGYSSLAMLHRVPAGTLKIDRGLVSQVGTPSGRAVLTAVVAVAKAYGMRTIAEGVERVDEALQLRLLGVDLLQGFLFAPAEPINVLLARMKRPEWSWDVERSHLLFG